MILLVIFAAFTRNARRSSLRPPGWVWIALAALVAVALKARRHGTAMDSAPTAPRPPVADWLYDARRGVYYTKPVLRGWLHLIWFGGASGHVPAGHLAPGH
jgi:hypothetical protein